jgi:hypothetical protein
MYGHIAARVRSFLAEKGWAAGDLNEAMGVKRSNTGIYALINCRSAPGEKLAVKLAKAIGCKPSELRARNGQQALEEGGALMVLPPTPRAAAPPRPLDVLQFAVQSDGNARIRLDCVLPFEKATPLLRTLLDAGLVVLGKADDDQRG